MTAVDDDGTQDQVADYEGEGGEQVANNNNIRPDEQSVAKRLFFALFTVCPVGVFAPA
jgi:hypothetical protein